MVTQCGVLQVLEGGERLARGRSGDELLVRGVEQRVGRPKKYHVGRRQVAGDGPPLFALREDDVEWDRSG